jgi:putative PEP-CTERM system TPR-repeat lipoprotein
MAEAQAANKNNRAAEQSLRKALEIKPDMLDAQRGLIILMVSDKKYQDAIAIARAVQSQRPQDAAGFVFEGDVNVAQKDWVAAAAAYRAGLKQVQSPLIAIKLHAVLVNAGKTAEADKYAATWLKAQPKDTAVLTYLGDMSLARKDFAGAEKHYVAILKIQPENAVALNNLGWLSLQKGSTAEAQDYAQRANLLAPDQPAFMDTLAMVLSARGEHAKAIELQAKAIVLQPDSAPMKLNLATMYLAAGNKSKARVQLEALSKLEASGPMHKEVLSLLGQV